MITKHLTVTFTTPAFLGDAEQNGRWRTPPFKHLLREWWRVAWVAAGGNPGNIPALRNEEARLFGAASDGQGSRSLLRLRLEHWNPGRQRGWQATERVQHPEVGRNGAAVGADLYLGYGPLAYDRNSRGTRLKANAAIQSGEKNTLKLAFPESDAPLIEHTLALLNAFGTLGGRSRNGWGSVVIDGMDWVDNGRLPLRDWQDCLQQEWAHAIGQDDYGPLIWWTEAHDDWRSLMKTLAEIKIGLRTQFAFTTGNGARSPEARHWLSYPVTHHSVRPWGSNRLPNSLRFKVWRDADGYWGCVYHMPCKPPQTFQPEINTLIPIWQQVHHHLDETLERQEA